MKPKNTRRSKKELEENMKNALEKLVLKDGFSNITMLSLVKEADVDPNIFYRYHGSLESILEELSSKYDFWLSNTLDPLLLRKLGDRVFVINGFRNLYSELERNGIMQKLLLWELNEINKTTIRSANMRETMNLNLIGYYKRVFDSSGIDFSAINAIFIAGLYYIVLHKDISTFCNIDFNADSGKQRFFKAIEMLVNLVFDKLEQKHAQKDIIIRMQEDGVSNRKICLYLGLSSKYFDNLQK